MIDLDSKEVSPIIEDEKEDTFNAEHETADLAKHCSYDPFGDQGQSRHTAAKSKKNTNFMKTYKADFLVNAMADRLLESVKTQLEREKHKLESRIRPKDDFKENHQKNKLNLRKSYEHKSPKQIVSSKYQRKSPNLKLSKNSNLKIGKLNVKKVNLKKLGSNHRISSASTTLNDDDKRRKRIGCDFLKFFPKKSKPKKRRNIKKKSEQLENIKMIINNFDALEEPRERANQMDRSLNIKFDTDRPHSIDFQQMANLSLTKDKTPLKNTSTEMSVVIMKEQKNQVSVASSEVDQSDKNLSCHIPSDQPNCINVQTETADLEAYLTPRNGKDLMSPEIDFNLTSSRKADQKYKSIFSAEKAELTSVNEHIEEIDKSDKSIQIEAPSPPSKVVVKGLHDYSEEMDAALKHRAHQEKNKLKTLLKNRRISDRSYKRKKQIVEKWVESEALQIQKTQRLLLQGWMKANEIIAHLEKDKSKVNRVIEDRRSKMSPTSQNTSNFSAISFCRSENSVAGVSNSSFSNMSNLNHTTDYEV